MLKAEQEAIHTDPVSLSDNETTQNIWIAIVPILLLIGITGYDLYAQGIEQLQNRLDSLSSLVQPMDMTPCSKDPLPHF